MTEHIKKLTLQMLEEAMDMVKSDNNAVPVMIIWIDQTDSSKIGGITTLMKSVPLLEALLESEKKKGGADEG